jgi:hypothetical protein
MSVIQMSTAISDAVLCAAALLGMAAVIESDARFTRRLASIGFLLIAFGAAMGILRYGFLPLLEPWHRLVSSAAGMIGMPLIAAAMLLEARAVDKPVYGWISVVLLVSCWAFLNSSPAWRIVSGVWAQFLWLLVAGHWLMRREMRVRACFLLLAVGITLFAGLGVGNQGDWHGIPRVDLLHYLLALAIVALVGALGGERRRSEAWAYTA